MARQAFSLVEVPVSLSRLTVLKVIGSEPRAHAPARARKGLHPNSGRDGKTRGKATGRGGNALAAAGKAGEGAARREARMIDWDESRELVRVPSCSARYRRG